MAQIINTNMQSLKAQRNLATSQKALGGTLERLSTGLRINSAKDDAAGLAISERFSSQIKGFNQAIRNANDGVSLTQHEGGVALDNWQDIGLPAIGAVVVIAEHQLASAAVRSARIGWPSIVPAAAAAGL